ncbi:MAG: aldehyde dehydrogenase family protein [Conexivisphaerales archaeon]
MQELKNVYYNYIAGRWVEASTRQTYELHNPAGISHNLGIFQQSGAEDAKMAIDAAKEGFQSWKELPPPKRGEVLFRAWEMMKERAEDFARTITTEEGKTLADARGEVKRSLNVLEFMAGEGRRLIGEVIPSELAKNFIFTYRRPLGVVAVITPWNFPLSIPVWKIAPALVSGNAVVFKPASTTPLTAISLVKLFEEAGLPKGVLNMVTGPGGTVGKELTTNPDVKAVSFTGSTETGRWIYENASKTLKKVQCEMGGKNAVIVDSTADMALAAEGIVQGAFGSTGQRCTATSRVIVVKEAKKELVEEILKKASRIKVGNGMIEGIDMGPLSSEDQMKKVLFHIENAKEEGARLLTGGNRLTGDGYDKGYFIQPTVFDMVRPEMKIFQQEIFGPVLAISEADGIDEAIELANRSSFGLSGSIYTNNMQNAMKYIEKAEAGMLHVNSPTLGGEAQAPFGGIKESGLGQREQGRRAVEFYTEEIVVYIDYTGTKREAKFI